MYKSVFISDTHLGTPYCYDEKLLKFLKEVKCENLYLVGDIIDVWALKRKHYWNTNQTEILRRILKLSEKINVTYIAGNHDEILRPFMKMGFQIGEIRVADEISYNAEDGRKILVTHGDYYDLTMNIPSSLINFGARIWELFTNPTNPKFKDWLYKIMGTETVGIKRSRARGFDAVICGHTHSPKIREHYMNCGDWTRSRSALVENYDGSWELLLDLYW